MKQTLGGAALPLFLVAVAGCGARDGLFIDGAPGVKMLGSVSVSSEPLPAATTSGDEPSVRSAVFENSGAQTFNLIVTYTGHYPIKRLHIPINGKHYIFDVPDDERQGNASACDVVARQQGVTCTPECLKACACVSCSDQSIQDNLEGTCAAVCSVNVSSGNIGPGKDPYTSEAVFADYEYNGYSVGGSRVPGLLDSFSGCSASACAAAATAEKRATVKFSVQSWDFNLVVDNLVATSEPPAGPPAHSEPFAAAMVSNICPANVTCDPASR